MNARKTSLQLVEQIHPSCNLGYFVQATNRNRGSNVCLIDLAGSVELVLTYADLEASVRRAVGAFHSIGCKRGSRVAVALSNSSGFLVCFLALMRLGSIPVLLNFKLEFRETIGFILEDSGATGILTEPEAMPAVVTATSRLI